MSDSSSDYVECTSAHEGRQLVHLILPVTIEKVFNLMFFKSEFSSEFHRQMKNTNVVEGDWEEQEDGTKKRIETLTVPVTQLIGPKTANVTETQIMRTCSRAGKLYSIDSTSQNAGVPYADSFYISLHYCLKKTADDSTVVSIHGDVKYKKNIWGFVKGFIEKYAWIELIDYHESLSQALSSACSPTPAKPIKKVQSRTQSVKKTIQNHSENNYREIPKQNNDNVNISRLFWIVIILIVILITFNVILLIKLSKIDSSETTQEMQETFEPNECLQYHVRDMEKWQNFVTSTVQLLKKTEKSIINMQNLIFTHKKKL